MGLATKKGGAKLPEFIFEMFPVLKDMLHRRGGDLSGGQQQQLAIGRALAMRPRLLILDEPTEGIQPSIIKDIERAIRKLVAAGDIAILLVEQYYDFAKSLADHYVVLSRGEVVARGKGATMEAGQRSLALGRLVIRICRNSSGEWPPAGRCAACGLQPLSRTAARECAVHARRSRKLRCEAGQSRACNTISRAEEGKDPGRSRREGRGVNQGSAAPSGYYPISKRRAQRDPFVTRRLVLPSVTRP